MSECYLAFTETPLRPNVSAQHIYAKGLYNIEFEDVEGLQSLHNEI